MITSNRSIKNATWIIFCRVIQALLNLFVTMLMARFYGPSNYGLLNYAASVVAFVAPFMKLGFSTTLVQEIVEFPKEEGKTLGTALTMNLISSFLSIGGVAAFVSIANAGERATLVTCLLYSINLPFHALEMIQYWFQAKLKSKYTSITMLAAYIVVSIYRIILLLLGKNIYWFALSQAIDYCIISTILIIIYYKIGGSKLSIDWQRGKQMLNKSKYYILSSLMITIFAQTDKVMLKTMLGDEVTGFYSAAATCAGMTSFVFSAIIDSAQPVILAAKKTGQQEFEKGMTALYSIVIWLALIQSLIVTVFAGLITRILYGAEYYPSAGILQLLVWYTAFSYIGSARTIWILGEGKHHLLWKLNLAGVLTNVFLNAILIPRWGAMGAALASLVTQFFTNVFIGFIVPSLRVNNKLILLALNPVWLIKKAKMILKKG